MKTFLQLRALDKESSRDIGLLVARVLSLALVLHGVNKIKNFDGTAGYFANVAIAHIAPKFFAVFTILIEILLPLLMLLGLFTRWTGIAGTIQFLFVIFAADIPAHGVIDQQTGGFTFEPSILYAALFAILALAGPGRYSLDYAMGARVEK